MATMTAAIGAPAQPPRLGAKPPKPAPPAPAPDTTHELSREERQLIDSYRRLRGAAELVRLPGHGITVRFRVLVSPDGSETVEGALHEGKGAW